MMRARRITINTILIFTLLFTSWVMSQGMGTPRVHAAETDSVKSYSIAPTPSTELQAQRSSLRSSVVDDSVDSTSKAIPETKSIEPRSSIEKIELAMQQGKIDYVEALELEFVALFSPNELPNEYKFTQREIESFSISADSTGPYVYIPSGRCGTPIWDEILENYDYLSKEVQNEIDAILEDRQSYNVELTYPYPSPDGHFLFHYSVDPTDDPDVVDSTDTNNHGEIEFNENNAPDYVEDLAEYFETSWSLLVGDPPYQFDAPPMDGFTGGGWNLLDIYLSDLGYPGITTSNAFSAWIIVDVGISGTNDKKIVAAHELFHAIQASYDHNEDKWVKEGTARFIEDVVFDDVDDIADPVGTGVNHFLKNPDTSLLHDGLAKEGYSAVLFWKFYGERYGTDGDGNPAYTEYSDAHKPGYDDNGVDAIREFLEATRGLFTDGIDAVDAALESHSSNFDIVFKQWTEANLLKDLGDPYGSGLYDYLEDEGTGRCPERWG